MCYPWHNDAPNVGATVTSTLSTPVESFREVWSVLPIDFFRLLIRKYPGNNDNSRPTEFRVMVEDFTFIGSMSFPGHSHN